MKVVDLKMPSISMRIPTDQEYNLLMDVTHEDNALSHWKRMCSWVNDTDNKYNLPAAYRASRGYYSARSWNYFSASFRSVSLGFRPAFVLNTDTLDSEPKPGEMVVIGTLYMGGEPIRVPENPTWDGDIADYIPGAKLEMRPALDDPAYQVTAIKVADGVLVANRNLLKCISYEDLENQPPDLSDIEAVFIQIPIDDGFTHANIQQVTDALPEGKEYIPVTIAGNSSFAFGLMEKRRF